MSGAEKGSRSRRSEGNSNDWADLRLLGPFGDTRCRRHLFLYMSLQTFASGRAQQAVLTGQITGSDSLQ